MGKLETIRTRATKVMIGAVLTILLAAGFVVATSNQSAYADSIDVYVEIVNYSYYESEGAPWFEEAYSGEVNVHGTYEAYNAILAACDDGNIDYDFNYSTDGFYSINGLTAEGTQSWEFFVNGRHVDDPDTPIKDGDFVTIEFSTNGGEDIGCSATDNDKRLLQLYGISGEMKPEFDPDVHNYIFYLCEDDTGKCLVPIPMNRNFEIKYEKSGTYYDNTEPMFEVGCFRNFSGGSIVNIIVGDPAWPSINSTTTPPETYVVRVIEEHVTRLSGSTRYDTMKRIVRRNWMTDYYGGTIVLASGENFTDALAGCALVAAYDYRADTLPGAQLVLTNNKKLSWQAEDLLSGIHPGQVLVIGGPGAISDEVVDAIHDSCPTAYVERVYGKTRVQTAEEIYENGKWGLGWGNRCIIAYGWSFADALSVSPLAYANRWPIFLTNSSHTLDASTLACIKDGGFTEAIIVGGPNAVSEDVVKQLAGNGVSYERLWGDNRYETSLDIATWSVDNGYLKPREFGLATGQNFPDALAGAALCGYHNAPLLLMDSDKSHGMECTKYFEQNIYSVIHGFAFGGPNALSDEVRITVRDLIPDAFG